MPYHVPYFASQADRAAPVFCVHIVNMNKIIWSCWFQGRRNAPDLVTRCLASWETLNPGWDFRCLDAETIGRYVDLGEHVDLQSQTITAASLSDILRVLLLHEYGGVWVDATLYCNQPLDEWLPLAVGTGFFAFSRPAHDRALATWFIAAAPGNRLLAKWAARAIGYWRGLSHSNDYFWLHHQFGELCSTDQEARTAWESVPRISADGPHAIQSAGMYQPAESGGRGVDWTTPVFKLTHRLDENAYRPGCLVHHVIHSRELVEPAPERFTGDEAQASGRIAGLKVSTENLGDHVQILAAVQLLKRLGLAPEVLIDRDDEIATAAVLDGRDQPLGILLNGWFKTNPAEWPPHPLLTPVYLGYHIRLFQAPTLVSAAAKEHYRRFGPIGCRDRHTLSLLKSHGVDAFLSHCLSLTLTRRLQDSDHQTETFIVSRDKRILDFLPATMRSCEFLCHYSGTHDFGTNMQRAAELLALYRSRAKVIVTTLLHCALPAIAMGIPVVVFFPLNEGEQHRSDRERFSSLQEMIRVFDPNEANCVDWRGYTADVGRIKLALIDQLFDLARRWGRIPGARLGPIAPASALPVPSPEILEQLTNDPSRMHALASSSSPDRYRWGNPSSYKPDWSDRARLAAPLIPDGATVLEIGVGAGTLKKLIQHRCVYLGADLEPLDSDTRSLDLDNEPLPHERYDCIVALGVFEYLHHSHDAVAKVASSSDHIVISYCCTRDGLPSVAETRGRRGWVNHFSEAEFTRMFALLGLNLVSRTAHNATDDFEQIIFEFRRAAGV
jgi:hypothetical protein